MSATLEESMLETVQGMVAVCRMADLEPGWGEAAWLEGTQVAVYRTEGGEFFAASHHCPGTGAKVMARGILGDKAIAGTRVPTIACPLHKEVYRLDTGDCLSGAAPALPIHPVHLHQGMLWLEKTP